MSPMSAKQQGLYMRIDRSRTGLATSNAKKQDEVAVANNGNPTVESGMDEGAANNESREAEGAIADLPPKEKRRLAPVLISVVGIAC